MARSTRRVSADSTPSTHDYECAYGGCGFTSTGWATKGERDRRGAQHETEHKTGETMPELAEFRKG